MVGRWSTEVPRNDAPAHLVTELVVSHASRRASRDSCSRPTDVTLSVGMARGSAVRNRSEIVAVSTPRGPVEVVRQEMQGLKQRRSWTWFWLARRKGKTDWSEASTAPEAIRRATLLPPGKPPAWLRDVAEEVESKMDSLA